MIKNKYDEEYLRLFFRHSINFLNFYLKEKDPDEPITRKKGKIVLKKKVEIEDDDGTISKDLEDELNI